MYRKVNTSHRIIKSPLEGDLVAYVSGSQPFTAFALTKQGYLYCVHTDTGSATKLLTLAEDVMKPTYRIELTLGHDDRYLAITYQEQNNHDLNRGLILDLNSGETVMHVDIGDYRTGHTRFPLAFFTHDNQPIVIHGTDWNRIDATNLLTGQLLTERNLNEAPEEPDEWNCFSEWNGHLAVSPDQRRAACLGWVWHPIGMVYSWRLDNWLNGNPHEIDVSEEKKSHAAWDYFWDSEITWVDNSRLAIWCGHEMAQEITEPHVSIVNVEDETQYLIIEGPENNFYIQDEVLIAKQKDMIGLWCCNTGTQLGQFQGELQHYHIADREWLQITNNIWRFTRWDFVQDS